MKKSWAKPEIKELDMIKMQYYHTMQNQHKQNGHSADRKWYLNKEKSIN